MNTGIPLPKCHPASISSESPVEENNKLYVYVTLPPSFIHQSVRSCKFIATSPLPHPPGGDKLTPCKDIATPFFYLINYFEMRYVV